MTHVLDIKKNPIGKLLIFSLLCGLFSSCLEDINLDTGERILNVYCVLNQGPIQELELSYIAPTGGSSQPVIGDITISLYEEGSLVGCFKKKSETRWELDFAPQEGRLYRLEVNVIGEDLLTGETRYPADCKIRHLTAVSTIDGKIVETRGFEVESPEDRILWFQYESQEASPTLAAYIATDHSGVDGRGETIFPCDPSSPINLEDIDKGRFITVGRVLPQMFYGTPAFFHDKVMRIVHPAGYSRSYDHEKMKIYSKIEPPIEETNDKTGMFCIEGMNRTLMYSDLIMYSVSKEYDNYLVDYYFTNHDTSDFSALVYKKNHYTNIKNGTGIFGAYAKYQLGFYIFNTWVL